MSCKHIAIVASALFAFAAHGADVQVATAALLYETGQLAPVVELRSVAEDGATWRGGISGWTLSLTREKPVDRGRRLILGITATPYNAHSSRRIYVDGRREQALEFDDAAFTARAGMRIRQGEHASIEPAFVIGIERLGAQAPRTLRDMWRSPYAGGQLTERLRFITADDPLLGRIDGLDAALTLEAYRGNRTWTRAMLAATAGRRFGRVHVQQTLAAFSGSNLDTVSAFLLGGSWDQLGPQAIYGRRYAELRVKNGVNANTSLDFALTETLDLGVRGSVFRASSDDGRGTLLVITRHAGGIRMTAGAGRSGGHTTIVATLGGAIFRR
jgi:hypothetical protein